MAKAKQEPGERSTPQNISPDAMLLFLKQAALQPSWDAATLSKALGTTQAHAKEVASQIALLGYAEPVPRKHDLWRNTESGNTVAGARPPRLTRQKAEELLTDLADRASAFNLNSDSSLRIRKILLFDPIANKHDRIQDLDVLVEWDPERQVASSRAEEKHVIQELRARSPAIKIRTLDDSLAKLPTRVIWEA